MRTKQKISKTYLLSKNKSSDIQMRILLLITTLIQKIPLIPPKTTTTTLLNLTKLKLYFPITLKTMNPYYYCVHIILLRWHLDIVIHSSFSICFNPFSTSKLLLKLACLIECIQHLVVYLLSDMKKRKNIKKTSFMVSFSTTLNYAFSFSSFLDETSQFFSNKVMYLLLKPSH